MLQMISRKKVNWWNGLLRATGTKVKITKWRVTRTVRNRQFTREMRMIFSLESFWSGSSKTKKSRKVESKSWCIFLEESKFHSLRFHGPSPTDNMLSTKQGTRQMVSGNLFTWWNDLGHGNSPERSTWIHGARRPLSPSRTAYFMVKGWNYNIVHPRVKFQPCKKRSAKRKCGGYWRNSNCVFGLDDWDFVMDPARPHLFANKFDCNTKSSSDMVTKIEDELFRREIP